MQVPIEIQTDRVSNTHPALDPEGHAAVEWAEKKARSKCQWTPHVKLIIQPDDGLTPLVKAVRNAKKTIDIVIFRFDRVELEKALEAAVARGVVVRALIAHTNRGGEKMPAQARAAPARRRGHRVARPPTICRAITAR